MKHYDFLGQELHVGDHVIYAHGGNDFYFEKNVIVDMNQKKVKIQKPKDWLPSGASGKIGHRFVYPDRLIRYDPHLFEGAEYHPGV